MRHNATKAIPSAPLRNLGDRILLSALVSRYRVISHESESVACFAFRASADRRQLLIFGLELWRAVFGAAEWWKRPAGTCHNPGGIANLRPLGCDGLSN